MENRDSSVLRNLAVAIGGGFGAGMASVRRAPAAASSVDLTPVLDLTPALDLTPVLERLEKLEHAAAVMDPRVVTAIVRALDERIESNRQEWQAQMNVQLATMRSEIAVRDERITALEGRVNHTDGRIENVIRAIAEACDKLLGRKPEAAKRPAPISISAAS